MVDGPNRRGGNPDTQCERFVSGALDTGDHAERIFPGVKTINHSPPSRLLKSTSNSSSTKKSVQA
jgi:hypothetical protein